VANSFLNKDESASVKGFLMILIIVCHCGLLAQNQLTGEFFEWRNWVYNFHVQSFFFLPFVYGCKILKNKNEFGREVKKDFIKLYVPYIWFTVICTFIFVFLGKGNFYFDEWSLAVITGNQGLLSEYSGFHFLWFLPSMFAVLFFMIIFYNVKKIIKIILLFISLDVWIVSVFDNKDLQSIERCIPFSLLEGLKYLSLGVIIRFLMNIEYIKSAKFVSFLSIIFFIIFSFIFFRKLEIGVPRFMQYGLCAFFLPLTFLGVLYSARKMLSKSTFLRTIGDYSLQIYLVHVIVYNVLIKVICPFLGKSVYVGLSVLVLMTLISFGIAFVMKRCPFIMKYVFPNGKPTGTAA
jgi:peptidoglycan/LPS O-acetylase OafA/YrhL